MESSKGVWGKVFSIFLLEIGPIYTWPILTCPSCPFFTFTEDFH